MPGLIQTLFDFLVNRPIILLILMAVPLFALARIGRVYPSRRMLLMATISAIISVTMIVSPTIGWYVLVLDILLLVTVLVDLLTVVHERKFEATRTIPGTASLVKIQKAKIELINRSTWNTRVAIRDDLPQTFEATPKEFQWNLAGTSRTVFRYQFTCLERGRNVLRFVHLRVSSRLGLWNGYFHIPCVSVVNVYPDMKQITEFDLLAKTNRLSQMGLRRTRKIGQDNEFERLRDYTQDDNYKHIDWRTSARRRKLTVKDFQSNQSQRVIFMVDCGRMMTGMAGEISMLDHALNAMLMMSYVALRQGDSVGLITFSNTIHNYTPARAGANHINRLLHASFDQKSGFVESRYDKAFLYLRSHCRKRSLVVLITNVIDEINAHQIRQYLGALTGRHLPLGVLLRDRDMFSAVDQADAENPTSLFRGAAAVNVLSWRQQVITDLKHQGVLALDVFPEQLTSSLVNEYLEVKARHLL